jgi:hypothetical protein
MPAVFAASASRRVVELGRELILVLGRPATGRLAAPIAISCLVIVFLLALLALGLTPLALVLTAFVAKAYTMICKSVALMDFQIAKGIGNGLVTRGEIAQVAMCADNGRYATQARADNLASLLVIFSLFVLLASL